MVNPYFLKQQIAYSGLKSLKNKLKCLFWFFFPPTNRLTVEAATYAYKEDGKLKVFHKHYTFRNLFLHWFYHLIGNTQSHREWWLPRIGYEPKLGYYIGALAFDATANSSAVDGTNVLSVTYSHTCTGSDRGLVVTGQIVDTTSGDGFSGATYNAVSMTSEVNANNGNNAKANIWSLINPASGANNVVMTVLNATLNSVGSVAVSFSGANQTDLVEATGTATGSGTTISTSVTTVTAGAIVVDAACCRDDAAITVGAGQTQRANFTIANAGETHSFLCSTEPAASPGAVTMSWDNYGAGFAWAIVGVAVKPSAPPDLSISVNDPPSITENLTMGEEHNINVNDAQTIVSDSTTTGYDSFNESNVDAYWTFDEVSHYFGQSFLNATKKERLNSVEFYIKKYTGTLSGDIYCKIYRHSGTFGTNGVPTGNPIATSEAVDSSTISTTPSMITFNFTGINQMVLTPNVPYIAVIHYQGSDASNRLQLGCDNSSSSHQGNSCNSGGGSAWNSSSQDNAFKINTTPITADVDIDFNISTFDNLTSITESVTIQVESVAAPDVDISVFDNLTSITESAVMEMTSFISVFDNLTSITESVVMELVSFIVVYDDLTSITENITVTNTDLGPLDVYDALTMAEDSPVANSDLGGIDLFDSITIEEMIDMESIYLLLVSDSLTIEEMISVTNTELGPIDIADTLTIVEDLVLVNEDLGAISIAEAISINENYSLSLETFLSVFDEVVISESFEATNELNVSVNDSKTISESVTLVVADATKGWVSMRSTQQSKPLTMTNVLIDGMRSKQQDRPKPMEDSRVL